jgi:hypothetical protein
MQAVVHLKKAKFRSEEWGAPQVEASSLNTCNVALVAHAARIVLARKPNDLRTVSLYRDSIPYILDNLDRDACSRLRLHWRGTECKHAEQEAEQSEYASTP